MASKLYPAHALDAARCILALPSLAFLRAIAPDTKRTQGIPTASEPFPTRQKPREVGVAHIPDASRPRVRCLVQYDLERDSDT